MINQINPEMMRGFTSLLASGLSQRKPYPKLINAKCILDIPTSSKRREILDVYEYFYVTPCFYSCILYLPQDRKRAPYDFVNMFITPALFDCIKGLSSFLENGIGIKNSSLILPANADNIEYCKVLPKNDLRDRERQITPENSKMMIFQIAVPFVARINLDLYREEVK